MKKTKTEKGIFEGKGFLFLAGVLLLIAIGIIVGRYLFPAVVADYYVLGIEAKDENKYGEAYYYLNKAIEVDPEFADSYVALSDILVAKGSNEKAVALLEEGIAHVTPPTLLRQKLVPLYFTSKEYVKEQDNLLSLANEVTDTNLKAQYSYSLGLAYLRQLELDAARDSFKYTLDQYSGTEWYYRASLELSLFSLDDETTRNAMLAIAGDALSPVTLDSAKIQDKLNKATEAKNRKDLGQMWGWYGVAMLEQDRCELSEPYFLNGITEGDKHGVHAGIHGYFGECLYSLTRYSEALNQVNVSLSADPLLFSSWETKAKTCASLGDYTCADQAFVKLITVDPSNTSYLSNYSDYLFANNREPEALTILGQLYTQSDEANKATIASRIVSLIFELETGYDMSASYIAVIDPNSSEFHDFNGWLMYVTDGSGKEEIEQALELDPFNASACYHYAVILTDEASRTDALDYAYKAIDYDLSGEIGLSAGELVETLENRT